MSLYADDRVEEFEELLQWLTEGHMEFEGGYPYDWDIFGDTLVIAGQDYNGSTVLQSYKICVLRQWEREARLLVESGECEDIQDAYAEFDPRGDA